MSLQLQKIIENEKNEQFSYLNDKLILDFANGLTASQDLQAVSKKRTSHINRWVDAISGKQRLREEAMTDHMLAGLKGCESWLHSLTDTVADHAQAISQLSVSLSKTQQHLANSAIQIGQIKETLNNVQQQTHALNMRLTQVEIKTDAHHQLDLVMTMWQSGLFNNYSPLGKCYLVLDNLYWGSFYKISQLNPTEKNNWMALLTSKLFAQLKQDLQVDIHEPLTREQWLENKMLDQENELIEYIGDWSLPRPQLTSNAFLATQWQTLSEEEQKVPSTYHAGFHISPIKNTVEQLTKEFFEVRSHG